MQQTKTCSKCKIEKSVSEFHKNKHKRSGIVSHCKSCACCSLPLGDNYHMDHIMPLALGGSNTDDNIQLLRAKCNMQKGIKHPVDFMQARGFLL